MGLHFTYRLWAVTSPQCGGGPRLADATRADGRPLGRSSASPSRTPPHPAPRAAGQPTATWNCYNCLQLKQEEPTPSSECMTANRCSKGISNQLSEDRHATGQCTKHFLKTNIFTILVLFYYFAEMDLKTCYNLLKSSIY